MDRFVDAPQFCHGLSKLGWVIVNSEGLHDGGRLYRAESERAGKPEHVIPILFNEFGADAMTGNAIQQTVIG